MNLKQKLMIAATVLLLMLASSGLSGCRREEKITTTPESKTQQLLPNVGGSPLPTPGTGLSPVTP